jgi:hypothetical protein
MEFNDRRNLKRNPFGLNDNYKVSENVTVKSPNDEPFDRKSLTGARQALHQNISAMPMFEPTASESKANARGLKAANKPKKVPMENVSKTATRIFGVPTTAGKPKMVVPGSKKAAKLQAKSDWSDSYEKKANAKFDARMKKGR